MQDRMPSGPRHVEQELARRSILHVSLSICLLLICGGSVIAEAQMRPMGNVTVGQRESTSRRAASATQTQSAQTENAPTQNASTPETPARTTAARETSAGKAGAREAPAQAVTRTRARRVSSQAASASGQAGKDARGATPVEELKAGAGVKAQSAPVVEIDMDEAPPMPAGTKVETDERGDATDSLEALRAQIKDAKDEKERARLQRSLVDSLVSLDQKHEALTVLRSMLREERVDPVGFYNLGNALARLGDTDTAIDAYRKAVGQRHGNYARALNNLGVLLLRQGRWDEAREALTNALGQENFRYAEASYNLGRLYAATGEADQAMVQWKRTLVLQPDHKDAALALARAYAEDGSPDRGLLVLDQFTGGSVPVPEITAARMRIMAEAAAAKQPERSEMRAGSIGVEAKLVASSASSRTLSVDPQTYALLQSARAAREASRYEEAIGYYRRVLASHKGFFPPANLEMSYALINLRRYDEAIALLSAVTIREGARYPVAYYHLARLYEGQGRLSLAEQTYNQALAIYGETNPQILLDQSRIRERQGNVVGALAAMQSYLRLSERHGDAPDWANDQINRLRQKLAALPAQGSSPKP